MRKIVIATADNKLIKYLADLLKTYPVLYHSYEDPAEKNFKQLKKNVVEISTSDRRNFSKAIVKVVNTWEQDDPKEFNVDLSYSNDSKKRKNIPIQMLPDYLCQDLFNVDDAYRWERLKRKLSQDSEALKKKYEIDLYPYIHDGTEQISRAMADTLDNLGDYLPKWLWDTPYMYFTFWGDLSSRLDSGEYGYDERVAEWYRVWEKKNLR
jgi:hypothetical protein